MALVQVVLQLGWVAAAVEAAAEAALPPVCPGLNTSRYPAMGCAPPNTCCKLNQQSYKCAENKGCNVCPECCHDAFAAPQACSSCVAKSCGYMELAQYGCQVDGQGSCCSPAVENASTALKNCLIIGDSVTSGQSGDVFGMLKDVCQTQKIIGW